MSKLNIANRIKKLGNSGDTIVEVVIVLAVIGLAISISYETANASTLNVRQAEENAQASNLAANQIESIRAMVIQGVNLTGSEDQPFCITQSGDSLNIFTTSVATPSSTCIASPNYDEFIFNCDSPAIVLSYPNECNGTSANSDTFVVEISWPDVAGDGNDTVTQSYRMPNLTS
jgi:type II secretory pathway pseudopilin PulG